MATLDPRPQFSVNNINSYMAGRARRLMTTNNGTQVNWSFMPTEETVMTSLGASTLQILLAPSGQQFPETVRLVMKCPSQLYQNSLNILFNFINLALQEALVMEQNNLRTSSAETNFNLLRDRLIAYIGGPIQIHESLAFIYDLFAVPVQAMREPDPSVLFQGSFDISTEATLLGNAMLKRMELFERDLPQTTASIVLTQPALKKTRRRRARPTNRDPHWFQAFGITPRDEAERKNDESWLFRLTAELSRGRWRRDQAAVNDNT